MGKHAAAEGASDDPIVAAALASRTEHAGRAHAAGSAEESPVGWPAPPLPGGGGLGWPSDPDVDVDTDDAEPAARAEVPEPEQRRGWRRLFGARGAA